MSLRVLALAFAVAVAGCKSDKVGTTVESAKPRSIKIAAASDLTFAFKEMGAAFQAKTGVETVFSFGSTGLLAKQISEGAPFDVFAAANVSFVEEVIRTGACQAETKSLYARGRIVVWTKKETGLHPASLSSLAEAPYVKIAIANPEHAPYGRAAEEAMKAAGVYDTIKPKLVFGENISQTMQFAESGNVEAAIVALSLASVAKDGEYVVIDDALHTPIDQAIVACGKVNEDARAFASFVNSEDGRTIMRRFGFLLPGEKFATAP